MFYSPPYSTQSFLLITVPWTGFLLKAKFGFWYIFLCVESQLGRLLQPTAI